MSSEPSMTDETRDDRGRLVSVVVDGQRFHRAPEAIEKRSDDDDERQVTNALLSMGFHRDDVKWAVRVEAVESELRSLRGVVQQICEWLAKAEPYPELNGNKFAEVRAALAAAADAPQPEPKEQS